MNIIFLDKLHHDSAATALAMRGSLDLVERGFMRWEAHTWSNPAVMITSGGVAIGVLALTENVDARTVFVDLAYVVPGHPRALAQMLVALRTRYAGRSEFDYFKFSYHEGNVDMAKAAKAFASRTDLLTHGILVRLKRVPV